MYIRKAQEKDIERIGDLLAQVLAVHAALRPDLFRPGTVKYTKEDLVGILQDETRPVFVAVDEADAVQGYAFCRLREPTESRHMTPHRTFFIDDLCVDGAVRGRGVGRALFEFVKKEAERLGCYAVTLNVWEGNDGARRFYEVMGMRPSKTQMEMIL